MADIPSGEALRVAAEAAPVRTADVPFTARDAGRRAQIDALRAIAVAWVLVDHYSPAGHGPGGWLSVSLFLMISGYLITHILLRGRDGVESAGAPRRRLIGNFYARRMLRIVPAYYLAVLATYAMHRAQFDGTLPWHLSFQSSVLYAVRNDWGPPWQLAHLWTLSIQEQFYFLWPLVMVLTPRRWLPWLVLGFATLGPLYRSFIWFGGYADHVAAFTLLPGSMTAICVGAGAAMLERRGLEASWLAGPRPWWLLGALIAFAVVSIVSPARDGWRYLIFDFVWLAPLAALLISTSMGIEGPVGRLLGQGWLQYLGRISLGIYLFQYLGFELSSWALTKAGLIQGRGVVLTIVAMLVTAAMAHLSWTLMERRVNALKRFFPYR